MSSTYAADIEKLYYAYLERPAMAAELGRWEAVADANHGSTAALVAELSQSSEYQSLPVNPDPYAAVNGLYHFLFNRDADGPGLQYWGNVLSASTLGARGTVFAGITAAMVASAQGADAATLDAKASAAQQMTALLDNPMANLIPRIFMTAGLAHVMADHPTLDPSWFWYGHGTLENKIQSLYIAYLGRPVDPDGLTYWEHVSDLSYGSMSPLAKALAQSAEYKQLTQTLTPYQVVNQIYDAMFGHDADLAGLNYWAQTVIDGKVKVEDLGAALAAGAQGDDLKTLNVKIEAAHEFTWAMRAADKIETYKGDAGALLGRSYLASATIATPHPLTDPGPPAETGPIQSSAITLVGTSTADLGMLNVVSHF